MAHVSHKLTSPVEGALAGGGDPATSPLYVFGPFLKLIVVAGVAQVTFGASLWLVILTIAMVSAMYRLVMAWVVDGSGGSGLSEEEFGSWAVKVNAGITFVEYTLTFLVSMAALVTFIADRLPALNAQVFGVEYRTIVAIALSIFTGWLVNRGPKAAARAFGPATAGVLLLLWVMIFATIWRYGFRLPNLDFSAFTPEFVGFTFGGYARILAVMTGIEIFANLVAAYEGAPARKSRMAFRSLLIIMGTTGLTMLIVGPAIFDMADPTNTQVSVFTQTMDLLLPAPLAYAGTLVGIAVLLSASAASAQGLQFLALGLKYRHYLPAFIGQRNRFEVADKPVWIEVGLASLCFIAFGTHEETYLAIYAAGVFILLSMTGWAATKRLTRELRAQYSFRQVGALLGTASAALLTSGATIIIFGERFREGAWTYLLFLPALYAMFSFFRSRLGAPPPVEEHLGRVMFGRYLAPAGVEAVRPTETVSFDRLLVPLDGSPLAEQAISVAETICHAWGARLTLVSVLQDKRVRRWFGQQIKQVERRIDELAEREEYLEQTGWRLNNAGIETECAIVGGAAADAIHGLSIDQNVDLIVMSTRGRAGVERWVLGSVANKVVQLSATPVLLLRPGGAWRSRTSQFKRILATLDGSPAAEQVLPFTRALAGKFESKVILLAVADAPEAEEYGRSMQTYLDGVVGQLRQAGLNAEALVTGSEPVQTILNVSESEAIDLIMIATHGRGGLDRLMVGSVADRVVQNTTAPVFLVPVVA